MRMTKLRFEDALEPSLYIPIAMISEKIWDIDFITESNIVDVYINFLRTKIDKGHDKKVIKTVRSVGYIVKE